MKKILTIMTLSMFAIGTTEAVKRNQSRHGAAPTIIDVYYDLIDKGFLAGGFVSDDEIDLATEYIPNDANVNFKLPDGIMVSPGIARKHQYAIHRKIAVLLEKFFSNDDAKKVGLNSPIRQWIEKFALTCGADKDRLLNQPLIPVLLYCICSSRYSSTIQNNNNYKALCEEYVRRYSDFSYRQEQPSSSRKTPKEPGYSSTLEKIRAASSYLKGKPLEDTCLSNFDTNCLTKLQYDTDFGPGSKASGLSLVASWFSGKK